MPHSADKKTPTENQLQRSTFCFQWKLIQTRTVQLILATILLIITLSITIPTVLLKEKNKFTVSKNDSVANSTVLSITTENPTTWTETIKTWKYQGYFVAGGNGPGNELNQLNGLSSFSIIDDSQTILIVDSFNKRIMEWKWNASSGRILLSENESDWMTDSHFISADIIYDESTDSIYLCDGVNRRIIRWSRQDLSNREIIVSNTDCVDIVMDKEHYLYILDTRNENVKRWKDGIGMETILDKNFFTENKIGTFYIDLRMAVGSDGSIYISDYVRHVVVKWVKSTSNGIIVAGGNSSGNELTQLFYPRGIVLDDSDNLYIADPFNNRVVCWEKGAKQGRLVVGYKDPDDFWNNLNGPSSLAFDKHGNMYVTDSTHHGIKKFPLDLS